MWGRSGAGSLYAGVGVKGAHLDCPNASLGPGVVCPGGLGLRLEPRTTLSGKNWSRTNPQNRGTVPGEDSKKGDGLDCERDVL